MAKNLISIPENVGEWHSQMKDYESQRKQLEWGSNPKQQLITNKVIKERDNIFNPILQVYNNKEKESHLRVNEQVDLIQTLAKNKVRYIIKIFLGPFFALRANLRSYLSEGQVERLRESP